MSHELAEFDALKGQVTTFVAPVHSITVTDAASNAVASGILRTIKELMKQIEGKRVGAVKPLNDRVKEVNAYASEVMQPLLDVEGYVKSKMAAFADAERIRAQEEQAKIDREREAAVAKLREEQRKAEAEAMAKREAEQIRIAEEQAVERKALADKQKKDAAAAKMFGIDEENQKQDAAAARKALDEKAAAERKAASYKIEQEHAEASARMARQQKEREAQLNQQERELEAARPKNTKQVAKWRVVDPSKLPDEFWCVDDALLGSKIRLGARDIPGVEIRMETVVVAR